MVVVEEEGTVLGERERRTEIEAEKDGSLAPLEVVSYFVGKYILSAERRRRKKKLYIAVCLCAPPPPSLGVVEPLSLITHFLRSQPRGSCVLNMRNREEEEG